MPRRLRAILAAEDGFGLIEVLISAVLVGVIATATFTGFEASNRTSADERAHAQADVLAQQDEDRLRSMQISQISSIKESRTVKYNNTEYTVKSSGEYISDTTGSESCSTESQTASYVKTISTVSWPALGSRPPVVETGLITPPVGGELLVQVFDGSGVGVAGMTVEAIGPSPSTSAVSATTGTNGCVIFSSLTEGEYKVTTRQTGYVDKDGNSEPPESQRGVTVTTGATAKKSFQFARAGGLKVSFLTPGFASPKGDAITVYNTNMTLPSYIKFGTVSTYVTSVETGLKLFPFGKPGPPATSPYTVYAGSCEANLPKLNGQSSDPSVNVIAGEASTTISVPLPAVNIKVMNGTSSGAPGTAMAATATLTDNDAGCSSLERRFTTEGSGARQGELPNPGLPFGNYALCVSEKFESKAGKTTRRYTTTIANQKAEGTSPLTIYLGGAEAGSKC